jgi:hypothetical protein
VGELKFGMKPWSGWSGLFVFNMAGTQEIGCAAPDAAMTRLATERILG